MNEHARMQATRMIKELEVTIKNTGSISESFGKIAELGRGLRDVARNAHGFEPEDRMQVFELMRHAKLLALAHPEAQDYLWRLERLEDDIRRVA